jgi:hypothetical protein
MFLHLTFPYFLAPIAIQNVLPAQKSTGMMLGRIHQMVKTSGPVLTKVYQEVLLAAVAPLTPSPDH